MSKLIVGKDSEIVKSFKGAQEASALVDQYDALLKDAKKKVDTFKDLVKSAIDKAGLVMADSPVLIVVEVRGKEVVLASDKFKNTSTFASKQFGMEHPDLLKKFTTSGFQHGITVVPSAEFDGASVTAEE
jgi:hypothetical protein